MGLAEPEADVFPSTPSRSTTTQKDRNLAVDCKMEDEVDLNAKLPDVVILEYPYKGGILSEVRSHDSEMLSFFYFHVNLLLEIHAQMLPSTVACTF